MKRAREPNTEETSILDLVKDVFDHAFNNNCKISTYTILSMTCKHFYMMFYTQSRIGCSLSASFLKEDNLLWYRNLAWSSDHDTLLEHGGIACLTRYIESCSPSIMLTVYEKAATKGYLDLLILIDTVHSEEIKKQFTRESRRHLLTFYEYVFFEYALVNQQFACCDYLYHKKCNKQFRIYAPDDLPEATPIQSWHYLLDNAYLAKGDDVVIDHARDTGNTELLRLFTV